MNASSPVSGTYASSVARPLAAKKLPWNKGYALSLPEGFDEASARAAIMEYGTRLVAEELPFLSADHLYIHFEHSLFGGSLRRVDAAVFGSVDVEKLAAAMPRFAVIRRVEMDVMVSNNIAGSTAVHPFSALDGADAAYVPTLSIFCAEMDLAMRKVRGPKTFIDELASAFDEKYRAVMAKIERFAEVLLLPNEF